MYYLNEKGVGFGGGGLTGLIRVGHPVPFASPPPHITLLPAVASNAGWNIFFGIFLT